MRNKEITKKQMLLDKDGNLNAPGWSRKLTQEYDRNSIKASKVRIKEWDYYLVMGDSFGAAFTISDNGYLGLESVSLLDFEKPGEHTNTILTPFPLGKLKLPSNSQKGVTSYRGKGLNLRFEVTKGKRRIQCKFLNFKDQKDFSCDITLFEPEMDTMVIATPFKDKSFYYNQKINCMPAKGIMKFGDQIYRFHEDKDFGILDWGRGVWTYDNTWYWGSGSGYINGDPFGFNIGYGFGDTSAATENIIFYKHKGHKIDDVTFHIPEDNYLKPWKFTSSDGRFEMDFVPIIDRFAHSKAVIIESEQHQVFGRMTGFVILDDGTKLEIKDFLCFAEKVHNRF